MPPAKKQGSSPSAPRGVRGPIGWLLGAGRPVLIVALLVGAFGGGAYLLYLKFKPKILSAPEFRVGLEQVEITPLPGWIHCKVNEFKQEVFCNPALARPLSLTDEDLTDWIAKAFAQHAWVAKVVHVSKHYPSSTNPASVKVELVYRRPVCMVDVPGGAFAVDEHGVLLPSKENFTSNEALYYPHLSGIERQPVGPVGSRWIDARVIGGAEIAAALAPMWELWKLRRIVPLADPAAGVGMSAGGYGPEPVFALVTSGRSTWTWGYAPGATRVSGEISAAEKVARLKRYFDENDTLDGPNGQPQQRDVRTLGQGATGTH